MPSRFRSPPYLHWAQAPPPGHPNPPSLLQSLCPQRCLQGVIWWPPAVLGLPLLSWIFYHCGSFFWSATWSPAQVAPCRYLPSSRRVVPGCAHSLSDLGATPAPDSIAYPLRMIRLDSLLDGHWPLGWLEQAEDACSCSCFYSYSYSCSCLSP